jgi:hypothetical protein
VTAETSLSADRKQALQAGPTTAYVFGFQPVGEGMKVFYAY